MAEILLSLTIIGVVAAITLPSLTGNINERTWNTQRKALYARMSQAISLMPSLNGFGTFTEGDSSTSAVDTAAETFVSNGLAKVLKINNICDYEHLEDCGFASNIIATTGSKAFSSFPTTLYEFNDSFSKSNTYVSKTDNTKAAAFETVNGESLIVYYNPRCISDPKSTWEHSLQYSQPLHIVQRSQKLRFLLHTQSIHCRQLEQAVHLMQLVHSLQHLQSMQKLHLIKDAEAIAASSSVNLSILHLFS